MCFLVHLHTFNEQGLPPCGTGYVICHLGAADLVVPYMNNYTACSFNACTVASQALMPVQ